MLYFAGSPWRQRKGSIVYHGLPLNEAFNSDENNMKWALRVILMVSIGILNCVGYLGQAANGQLEILRKRRPIQSVIDNPTTPKTTVDKLRLVLDVQQFAAENLKLRVGKSYSLFTQLDRDAVAYNVIAVEPLRFKSKTWWFPIVGSVPYLGYFDKADADNLADELRLEGWDVRVDEVAAYSTLGWFNDPLLSPQLRYGDYFLVSLVIHECAHATTWYPNDIDFNEAFASFVEEQGALAYFQAKNQSHIVEAHSIRKGESKQIFQIIRGYAEELSAIYGSQMSVDDKTKAKEEIFGRLKHTVQEKTLGFRYLKYRDDTFDQWNNANIISYLRYESGRDYFSEEFERCDQSWPCFLEKMDQLKTLDATNRKQLLVDSSKSPITSR